MLNPLNAPIASLKDESRNNANNRIETQRIIVTMEISRTAIRMTRIVSRKTTEELIMIAQSIRIGERSSGKKS